MRGIRQSLDLMDQEEQEQLTRQLARVKADTRTVLISLAVLSLVSLTTLVAVFIFLKREIARRRHSEEALRQRDQEMSLMIANIPAIVFKGSVDGSVDFFDPRVEELTGYPREDFGARRLKWVDLILPEDLANAKPLFIHALKTTRKYVREYRIRTKGEEIRWIQERSCIVCDPQGKVAYVSGIFFDISEARRTEEIIKQHSFLQTLMDAIPAPVFYKDINGIYLGCNRAFETFLNLGREEIIGKPVFGVSPEERADIYLEKDQELFQNPGVQVYESTVESADGARHQVIFNKATFTDPDGHLAGLIGVILDITERQRAEEALRERVKELTCFCAVSRDLQEDFSIDELCRRAVEHLVPAMQFPEITVPVIELDGKRFTPKNYTEGLSHGLHAEIRMKGVALGHLRVYYAEERPFLIPEEQNLVNGVAEAISTWLERQRAEESRRESEENLRALFNTVAESIIFLAEDGAILTINETAARRFRTTPEEIIGANIWALQPLELAIRRRQKVEEALRQGQALNFQDERDGMCFENRIYPVPDAQGKGNRVVIFSMDITERRRTEETLRESEERYRTLVENIDLAINWIGPDYRVKMTNASMDRFFKKSESELIGQECFRMFEKREAICPHCPGRTAMATGQPVEADSEGVRDDGSRFPVRIHAAPSFGPDGAVTGFIEVVADISERKQGEEKLRSQAALLDLANDAIIVRDLTDKIIFWNRAAEAEYGWASDEAVGKVSHILLQTQFPKPLPEIKEELYRRGGWDGELVHSRRDGGRIVLASRWAVQRDEHGEPVATMEINRDITLRKQQEEALRQSEESFRRIVETAHEGIWTIDADNRMVLVNERMAELLGYTVDEMIGQPISTFFDEEWLAIASAIISERLQKGFKEQVDLKFRRRDGAELWAITTASRILDREGRYLGALGMITDITARKQADEALRESFKKVKRTLNGTAAALAAVVENRDPYTPGHQRRVAQLACAIAQELGFSPDEVAGIQEMGYLHDIGKISVPAEILSRPGKISEIEFTFIKIHTRVGYDILKDIEFSWPVAQATLQQHERLDGSGYPDGLKGQEIILEARILAVADVVEAMASHRPYRPALGIDKALEEISQNRDIIYDPDVVDACVNLFTEKGFSFMD